MATMQLRVDLNDPSTYPKGRINYEVVDATTQEDIARHKKEYEDEVMQEMAKYTRELRQRLKLSQVELAYRLNVSVDTLRNWEQGKRYPSGPARALLHVLDKAPETALLVLNKRPPAKDKVKVFTSINPSKKVNMQRSTSSDSIGKDHLVNQDQSLV
ncbi:MAG: helix-turn-helix domain-containing protein [Paracoccaceae bacterium]|nr:helix-turn-helix domain-containing protein [Paracoccaceae bacterium]MDE2738375.1 helix-turn-helix domain-containing protein [Paracoccaceae bacterium]MDE2758709.1 helix-turn-helix domain-containing protein [Paracoccaceae bacterium]MDE2917498.1 helix-turn-helix domain-containing protein [Paracoccaceae bacterium]